MQKSGSRPEREAVPPGEGPEAWKALRRFLADSPGFSSHRLEQVPETGSTNDDLKSDWGRPIPRVRIADHQTAGRGQAGRSWWDLPGTSLLLSFTWREAALPPDVAGLNHGFPPSLVVGIALHQAVSDLLAREWASGNSVSQNVAGEPWLKWPNDLWWRAASPVVGKERGGAVDPDGGKEPMEAKLGGVLAERSLMAGALAGESTEADLVIGIGVNLLGPVDRLPNGETRMTLEAAGCRPGRPLLVARLFSAWEELLENPSSWHRLWTKAASPLWGRPCEVTDPDGTVWQGIPRDVCTEGSLLVETPDRHLRKLSTFQRIRPTGCGK